ncbi:MAG TPA: hypothetical protein VMV72_13425 [Verrucomicrobiae bacterium]|nr:hypothetical protein [Verrucomicrobiae bacterium]
MRTTLIALAAFLTGLVLGWGIHRSRDVEEMRRFRALVGLSDQQIHELYQTGQETMRKMDFDNGMEAVTCLTALSRLHNSQEPSARELLAKRVASYYVVYGPLGNTEKRMDDARRALLRKIDAAKDSMPELQAAIEKELAVINTKP